MDIPLISDLDVQIHRPCGQTLARPGWGRDRDTSLRLADEELWFVTQGRGWMRTRDRLFTLRPGFCVWMRPGGVYDAGGRWEDTPEPIAGPPLGFSYIHFVSNAPLERVPEFFEVREIGFMNAALRRIIALVNGADPTAWGQRVIVPPAAPALLRAVLLDLLAGPRVGDAQGGDPLALRIQSMAAEIRDDPVAAPPVANLAHRCGVSPAHFSRRFRTLVGRSPQQHRQEALMDRARHLLAESSLSVTEIAGHLGYEDVYQFSRQFKRQTGLAPTALRHK